ncbi:MAG: O-antigen ligase family protein [Armatimonadota bacterium]|nr:O-antigen ligase family protein [Armatimonadota bacterium]
MKRLGLAGGLFIVGLFLVAIIGGQLRMGVSAPVDTQSFFNRLMLVDKPAFGHMLLALPIVLAVAIAAFKRGVLQMPSMAVWIPLTALFFWLAIGVPASPTRYEAILDFARWVAAFAAMIGCCFLLGRDKGPRFAAWALFAGISLVGVVGVAEFAEMSREAGNWRIFAGWFNPNAVAGILIVGIPLGLGLYAGAEERLEKLLIGFGLATVLAALWFSGSKGGLAAGAVGLLSYVLFALIKRGMPTGWGKGIIAGGIAGLLLIALLGTGASLAGTSSVGGRLTAEGGAAAEQSVMFRAQLWKDTVAAIQDKPLLGHGSGSYSLVIRREGETLGSELAHQTYLQIAAEVGVIGLGIALALIVAWLFVALRKHPSEPPDKTALRYAVVAAVLAVGANGLVESNLSYFGIRVALFALLGLGLNLSVDGLVPERIPVALRGMVASLLAIGAGYTFVAATVADQKVASALSEIKSGNAGVAQRLLLSARRTAPADPQPTLQLAKLAGSMNDWKSAADLAAEAAVRNPDASTYSVLAQAEQHLGRNDQAIAAIDKAIYAEPNDPYWRTQKFELLRAMGLYDHAEVAARDAVEAETKLDRKPNALPWLVSTDTLNARQWLLSRAKSTEERVDILRGIFDRLADYLEKTGPEVARVTGYSVIADAKRKLGPDASDEEVAKELKMSVGAYRESVDLAVNAERVGESVSLAREKQTFLLQVGEELERIYRSEGDVESADAVKSRLGEIKEAGVLR